MAENMIEDDDIRESISTDVVAANSSADRQRISK
jgi:hypothetical protein